ALGLGEQVLDVVPLQVGQVTRVALSGIHLFRIEAARDLGRALSRPISRIPVLEAMPSITGFERQPSGSGANTWANSCAGVGNPNCRRTRACSGVSRVACTTRPKRVRRSISPYPRNSRSRDSVVRCRSDGAASATRL